MLNTGSWLILLWNWQILYILWRINHTMAGEHSIISLWYLWRKSFKTYCWTVLVRHNIFYHLRHNVMENGVRLGLRLRWWKKLRLGMIVRLRLNKIRWLGLLLNNHWLWLRNYWRLNQLQCMLRIENLWCHINRFVLFISLSLSLFIF